MFEYRLSRRNACRALAGAAATAVFRPWAACADDAGWSPTFVLSSSLYGLTPLAEILPEVARTGAVGIDLWPKVHANQREQVEEMGHDAFRDLLEMHGVPLYMTTRYDLGPFNLADELQFIHDFGGKLIVTGAHTPPGENLDDRVRAFVAELQPHVDRAAELGVSLAIENHASSLLDTPEAIRCFADHAASTNLGVALAPYHLPQDPQLLAGLIDDLGPKLLHFYAWEHGQGAMTKLPKDQELQQLPGYGAFDFAPAMHALRRIKFAGAIQVFMHPVPRGVPILDTTAEISAAVNRSRESLLTSLDRA
ncbi:MAG: sugar phosphate isomerase/epimerase [Planctomycetaceae bacterium]|nr:sugar phosphate isomerase/epimerase [Planctomycetaceae bacterium]